MPFTLIVPPNWPLGDGNACTGLVTALPMDFSFEIIYCRSVAEISSIPRILWIYPHSMGWIHILATWRSFRIEKPLKKSAPYKLLHGFPLKTRDMIFHIGFLFCMMWQNWSGFSLKWKLFLCIRFTSGNITMFWIYCMLAVWVLFTLCTV